MTDSPILGLDGKPLQRVTPEPAPPAPAAPTTCGLTDQTAVQILTRSTCSLRCPQCGSFDSRPTTLPLQVLVQQMRQAMLQGCHLSKP